MGYFPSGVTEATPSASGNPLVPVLRPLSPKGKQAMFAAANKGLILRGTWDGCAFNKAGDEVGSIVSSTHTAAKAFDCSPNVVERFIRTWDGLQGTDEVCTQLLREALEEVGLFTDPKEGRVKRVIRGYAYKSWETQMREQFDLLMQNDAVPATEEAEKLLCGVC